MTDDTLTVLDHGTLAHAGSAAELARDEPLLDRLLGVAHAAR